MAQVQEVQVKIGQTTFTLRYSWLAFCTLTDAFGATFSTVVEAMHTANAMDVDAVVWAGLRTHHPELTREDVRRMLDDMGTVPAMGVFTQASAAFAASLEPEGGSSTGNPLWRLVSRFLAAIGRWIASWRKPRL